ncbi:hypothetical protein Rhopal_001366-T1 [Rhodotorula paludigena]|uniref:Signal recognition particle receptor subunit beta n=1 Tax=Rhodotorula paludigena TaxID=86838 RepID=A0AAV5G7D6_9BASI|nr:hypothetical protein Rhopal_001366-T1 [Rhodotorula paludigena]
MPSPPSLELLSLVQPTSQTSLRIFLSLCVLLVFLVVAAVKPRGRHAVAVKARHKGARTVLLTGPLASGKTALFSTLVYGHAPQTHTSMKENEALVKAKWGAADLPEGEKGEKAEADEAPAVPLSTPLHLVDLPGHPRLRTRSLAQYLPAADGIVFAIDGQTGLTGKNVRDAGEHLHIVLSFLSLLSSRQSTLPPLLILLTKSDLAPSSSSSSSSSASSQLALDRARTTLLRELERRRLASSGSSSASASASSSTLRAGSSPLSAGAKLEGLDAIPLSGSASGGGGRGLVGSLLASVGLGSSPSSSGAALDAAAHAAGLPSDESELLSVAADDVFAFEGAASWDKLVRACGGVEVRWAVGSAKRGSEGVRGVWEWVDEL